MLYTTGSKMKWRAVGDVPGQTLNLSLSVPEVLSILDVSGLLVFCRCNAFIGYSAFYISTAFYL